MTRFVRFIRVFSFFERVFLVFDEFFRVFWDTFARVYIPVKKWVWRARKVRRVWKIWILITRIFIRKRWRNGEEIFLVNGKKIQKILWQKFSLRRTARNFFYKTVAWMVFGVHPPLPWRKTQRVGYVAACCSIDLAFSGVCCHRIATKMSLPVLSTGLKVVWPWIVSTKNLPCWVVTYPFKRNSFSPKPSNASSNRWRSIMPLCSIVMLRSSGGGVWAIAELERWWVRFA